MITKELEHHTIEGSYGGNQEWFNGGMMKLGGCGAETACESSIYFTMQRGLDLYPFDINHLTIDDYVKFGAIMKPYLSPRMTGIDRLDIFIDGFNDYLKDRGETRITMDEFSGEENLESAKEIIKSQIDKGFPIPMLMLNHRNKKYKDYDWHWFIVNGYKYDDTGFYIKAVTYSEWEWIDLEEFWDTGHRRKGGLVIFDLHL